MIGVLTTSRKRYIQNFTIGGEWVGSEKIDVKKIRRFWKIWKKIRKQVPKYHRKFISPAELDIKNNLKINV